MPTTVTCPNCRESLEIPNELLGGDVRCGSCREVFEAGAHPDAPPPEDRRRPRRRPADVSRNKPIPSSRPDDGYGPVEFDPDRRRKQGVGATLWIVFGVLGLFGCGCCGVFGFLFFQAADPKYQEYKAPDGRFVAQFPGDVKQKTRETGRGDEKAPSFEAERKVFAERETYFVYHVELRRKDAAQTLDRLCDGVVKANRGTELSRSKRTHQGRDALDVTADLGGDRHLQARVIDGGDRAYVIGVAAHGEPGDLFWLDKFFDGFEMNLPEAKKDEK